VNKWFQGWTVWSIYSQYVQLYMKLIVYNLLKVFMSVHYDFCWGWMYHALRERLCNFINMCTVFSMHNTTICHLFTSLTGHECKGCNVVEISRACYGKGYDFLVWMDIWYVWNVHELTDLICLSGSVVFC